MSELKPCPFCGGEAKLMRIGGLNTDKFQIRCRNNSCGISGKIYIDYNKARVSWNRRQ